VFPHPTDTQKAHALMDGMGFPGKVFKTTNRGVTWTNITGDLPNVPTGGLVAHPTDDNRLYLGSAFGCWRTLDGGTTWERWTRTGAYWCRLRGPGIHRTAKLLIVR
jgi:photosystem II stability/assembly factor-like uncharacterized protein